MSGEVRFLERAEEPGIDVPPKVDRCSLLSSRGFVLRPRPDYEIAPRRSLRNVRRSQKRSVKTSAKRTLRLRCLARFSKPIRSYAFVDTTVLSYFALRSRVERQRIRNFSVDRNDQRCRTSLGPKLDGRKLGRVAARASWMRCISVCVNLPIQVPRPRTGSTRQTESVRELGPRASNVGDNDLWIIAHAAEYGVPYLCRTIVRPARWRERTRCRRADDPAGRLSRARYVAFSV